MLKYYYPRTFEGITTAMLSIFNDVVVMKYDSNENIIEEKTIPITFGPTEKYHKDRIENHAFDSDNKEINQNFYLQIPRLALTFNGMVYAQDRASSIHSIREWFKESLELSENTAKTILTDIQPSPWNYNYTVYFKNDNVSYFAQFIENTLPYFNPTLTKRIKEFSFLNIERDLIVKMDGLIPDFSDDMNEEDTRKYDASINFTVEGFLYRPWKISNLIKTIDSKYLNLSTNKLYTNYSTSGFQIPVSITSIPTQFLTSGTLDKNNDNIADVEYYKIINTDTV